MPIVLALLVEKLFFKGLNGKQYFNDCGLNLLGFPFTGNFPISWFGVPLDKIHF
jgi:hypothetical protein